MTSASCIAVENSTLYMQHIFFINSLLVDVQAGSVSWLFNSGAVNVGVRHLCSLSLYIHLGKYSAACCVVWQVYLRVFSNFSTALRSGWNTVCSQQQWTCVCLSRHSLYCKISGHEPVGHEDHGKKENHLNSCSTLVKNRYNSSGNSWETPTHPEVTTKDPETTHGCGHTR